MNELLRNNITRDKAQINLLVNAYKTNDNSQWYASRDDFIDDLLNNGVQNMSNED